MPAARYRGLPMPLATAVTLNYNDLLLLFLGLLRRGQIATLGKIHVSCQN
jgi:hypothetical protein